MYTKFPTDSIQQWIINPCAAAVSFPPGTGVLRTAYSSLGTSGFSTNVYLNARGVPLPFPIQIKEIQLRLANLGSGGGSNTSVGSMQLDLISNTSSGENVIQSSIINVPAGTVGGTNFEVPVNISIPANTSLCYRLRYQAVGTENSPLVECIRTKIVQV